MPDDSQFQARLEAAYGITRDALLAERTADGFWQGQLASSALATATAVSALSIVRDSRQSTAHAGLIANGIRWLVEHQNSDGGWGDTVYSLSNISTTMLVRAALHLARDADANSSVMDRASDYVAKAGGLSAVTARYGADRTFAVPILANCALSGHADWSAVATLPFELACLPHGFYRFLRLHVVSYALPALIAIGQLVHAKRASNFFARWVRRLAIRPSLNKLESIQPESGGFLEAIPLTSFVTMSLAALDRADHPVVQKGVIFLCDTARLDGSWPIDSNLSVWLTTLSVNALAAGSPRRNTMAPGDAERVRDWLLANQVRAVHPYTNAAPGGWGWSHLSGSVPDADDTSGALLALANLPPSDSATLAARDGIHWLRDLQNSDGGWPTFCRGWGRLPFDRSGADLTAHAIRAIAVWSPLIENLRVRLGNWRGGVGFQMVLARSIRYLAEVQRPDGSWLPLWFGNQYCVDDENPLYGTSKVVMALREIGRDELAEFHKGVEWLIGSQNADGGWGGSRGVCSTVEETSLALETLASLGRQNLRPVLRRGVQWLVDRVESGDWRKPSPIGLYFAKLWYFEKLYPMIFCVAALGRCRSFWNSPSGPTPA